MVEACFCTQSGLAFPNTLVPQKKERETKMTKRNLLLVSLLLVFGLGVMAPSAMAQLTASTSVLTLRPNSNGEAVGPITLAETAATAIPAGETFNVQLNQPIVGASGIDSLTAAVARTDFCFSPSGYCSDFTISASGETLTLTVSTGFTWGVSDYVEIFGVRVGTYGLSSGTGINATVSTSPPTPPNTVLFTNGTNYISLIPVGTVAPTTALTASVPTTYPEYIYSCETYTITNENPGAVLWTVSVSENWAGAWTSLTDEAKLATYAPSANNVVTNGTIINITVTGIPKGMTVTPEAPASYILVAGVETAVGYPVWSATIAPTSYTGAVPNDTATFMYTITNTNRPTSTTEENAAFTFTLTNPSPLEPDNLPMAVSVTLGPPPSTTTPVYPAFSYPVYGLTEEAPGSPQNVMTFIDCVTPLLFPYITNYSVPGTGPLGSWDTAMEVANMTSVPFVSTSYLYTLPQNGSCAFSFYSAGTSTTVGTATEATPISWTTPVILSGGNYAFMLSATPAKGLTGGYAVAVCNFLNGGGYAEMVDNANGLGNWQVMAGYTAGIYVGPFPIYR
jgi:hypothetical protein